MILSRLSSDVKIGNFILNLVYINFFSMMVVIKNHIVKELVIYDGNDNYTNGFCIDIGIGGNGFEYGELSEDLFICDDFTNL